MSTTRKNLSVNSLDFEDIKANLKNYLRSQDVFKDYDFEGSAIATLVDILAYNTYYQGFYNNVVANEMFLDSAVKRSSVVSLAKSLGYIPKSRTAANAIVDLVYGSPPSQTVLLPGAQFTTTVNDKTLTFVNVDSANITETDGVYSISDLVIKEGTLTNTTFIVPDASNQNKYTITEPNIDASTIKVRIQSSQTDTTGINESWSRVSYLSGLDSTTNVFFVEENTNGEYEIFFGDGVLGKKPEPGNLVTVTYLITGGEIGNGAGRNDAEGSRSFRYLNADNDVIVKSPAVGGAEKETVNDIRFRAPRSYATQNRAVTETDFVSLIESNFTEFESVFVFGGEQANPPAFGVVYVALKGIPPETTSTPSQKQRVEEFLRTKSIIGVRPIAIDPDITYMRFNIDSSYEPEKTTLSGPSIVAAIRNNVESNIDINLGKFNKTFSVSKFLTDIDSASAAIESSSVDVTMEKKFLVENTLNTLSYTFEFGNPIFHPHDGHIPVISSNTFRYFDPTDSVTKNIRLEDDGFGNISFYLADPSKALVAKNVGVVDYSAGIIRLTQVQIFSPIDSPIIRIFAKANEKRYRILREKILVNDYRLDPSAIRITLNGIAENTTTNIANQQQSAINTVTSTFVG